MVTKPGILKTIKKKKKQSWQSYCRYLEQGYEEQSKIGNKILLKYLINVIFHTTKNKMLKKLKIKKSIKNLREEVLRNNENEN